MDNIVNTLRNLSHDVLIKLLASSIIAAFFYHAVLFCLFGCVVFLDLFTRWLALSHQHLVTHKQEATLVDCLYGIPSAHKAGLISSYVMRKTFFSKMITYLLLIIGASIVDYMIKGSGGGVMAVSLVITYLSMTELLSIVENLDEAGVSAMHDLIDLIKGRRM